MKLRQSLPRRAGWWLVMCGAAAMTLWPVLWTISTSFKSQKETYQFPPTIWPEDVRLSNYTRLFESTDFRSALVTSVVVTVGVTILVLVIAYPCAYALVRMRAWGSRLVLLLVAFAQTVPAIVVLIPLYSISVRLHLYDTRTVLILVYTAFLIPFSTLILMAFLRAVPTEIEEAALVDGCSHVRVLTRIVLPMTRPAIATAAVFTGLFAWNEFLIAAVLGGDKARPLTVMISQFVSQKTIEWGPMTAAVCLVLLPVVVAVVLLQRHLVSGLVAGALKA
ncbi:MAG: carbohydrate ABC transporter permease [Micrococcales bacterium]|nr:carbohydrate ABC transporter permease [Micrococcales bacterium]